MDYKKIEDIDRRFIAGVTLCGWQAKPGDKILSEPKGQSMDEWPTEIEVNENVYVLEEVERFENGFCNAQYC